MWSILFFSLLLQLLSSPSDTTKVGFECNREIEEIFYWLHACNLIINMVWRVRYPCIYVSLYTAHRTFWLASFHCFLGSVPQWFCPLLHSFRSSGLRKFMLPTWTKYQIKLIFWVDRKHSIQHPKTLHILLCSFAAQKNSGAGLSPSRTVSSLYFVIKGFQVWYPSLWISNRSVYQPLITYTPKYWGLMSVFPKNSLMPCIIRRFVAQQA